MTKYNHRLTNHSKIPDWWWIDDGHGEALQIRRMPSGNYVFCVKHRPKVAFARMAGVREWVDMYLESRK